MNTIISDFRYSIRMLFKHPIITVIAVVTLSLGMAGNTVIFSFFNAFFLRPMPFYQSYRLVDIDQTAPRWNLEYTGMAYPDFCAWREQNRSFEGMTVWQNISFSLSYSDTVERIDTTCVTHDMFSVLGIKPILGRAFSSEEDRPGGEKVVILTYNIWQRLFGQQDVLGQTLLLNREPYTIIGILPQNQATLFGGELIVPLAENPEIRKGWYLRGVGRLKPGVTMAMAQEDLDRIHQGLIEANKANENTSPRLTSMSVRYFGPVKPVLVILLGAVGVVLLIACGNVAALMLARGLARWRELGIRLSLGATSGRIIRLIGTESLLLSCLAGMLGLFVGYLGLHALLNSLADRPPQWVRFSFDIRIWLYAVSMVLVTAAFGALPTCYTVIRGHLSRSLNITGQHSTAAPKKRHILHLLVVSEVALTLVLLVQAGLLVTTFRILQKQNPGFQPKGVLTYNIYLPESQYLQRDAKLAFFQDHIEQIRALPGVISASAAFPIPLSGHEGNFYDIENTPALKPGEPDPVVLQRVTCPDYFKTMDIQLLTGRTFTEQDGINEGSQAVIVNETFANRFWPNQNPVGKRIRQRGNKTPWMTVVGVARDVKHYGLETPMIPGVYVPFIQIVRGQMTIVVHCKGDPLALVSSIRQVVRQSDPDLPVAGIQTMNEKLQLSLWLRRLYSGLIGIFSGVAMVMAMGGLYGVFSYVTNGRVREIGIRIAVGAHPKSVLWMILRQGLRLTLIGVAVGLIGAVVVVPLMRSILLGIHLIDLLTFAAVPVVLIGVAILACWIPARRAAKVDPMEALRYE